MKSPFRCLLIMTAMVVVLSAGAAEAPPGEPQASVETWKTLAASGPVEARDVADSEAPWGTVTRGDELEPRTLVRTGRRGRATLAQQASILMVDPNTELELPYVASPEGPSSVMQGSGSVVYEVDGTKIDDFKVVTPYLIAGVKGTTFLVSVTDRYAAVTVEHGVVAVTSLLDGETRDVHAGETLKVDTVREEAEMQIVSLESDPRALDQETIRFVRGEVRRLTRMVEDSVILVQMGGTGFDGERDLLGETTAGAATTDDPIDASDVSSSVSEWTQDAVHREAIREAPNTSTGGSSN
ncbi:MAG: FecR domain-containing protein [Acidobacteriota bacterium]|nr:FecR domain-containing protein [Acidobacteriota bacterium]